MSDEKWWFAWFFAFAAGACGLTTIRGLILTVVSVSIVLVGRFRERW